MDTKSRQDSLAVFLREHLSGDSLEEVMTVLSPFYQITEAGRYELIPQSEAEGLTDKMIPALKGIFGDEEVQGLAFFSLSHPFPRPDWMTEEVYQASLRGFWDSLLVSLGDSLGVSLGDSLRGFWDSLLDSLRDSLWVSLRVSLRVRIWVRLGDSLWDSLRDSLWDSLGDSLWDSLFFYLGLAIAGKQEKAQALKALVEILPHCIPIGTKKDQPKVWIVVCG